MEQHEKIGAVLGAAGGVVGRVFHFVDIAEDVIKESGAERDGRHPTLFAAACPVGFTHLDPGIYRAHVRELARRVVEAKRLGHDADLDLGTRAEVLVALMSASLKAPLTSAALATYERLFAEVMPVQARRMRLALSPEAWHGQVEDDIAAAQRAMRGRRGLA